MTEEQKRLLKKYSEINKTEIKEENETIDTLLPNEIESSGELDYKVARDESTLTYEELIEDYHKFNKPAVMTLKTFERLWNS